MRAGIDQGQADPDPPPAGLANDQVSWSIRLLEGLPYCRERSPCQHRHFGDWSAGSQFENDTNGSSAAIARDSPFNGHAKRNCCLSRGLVPGTSSLQIIEVRQLLG